MSAGTAAPGAPKFQLILGGAGAGSWVELDRVLGSLGGDRCSDLGSLGSWAPGRSLSGFGLGLVGGAGGVTVPECPRRLSGLSPLAQAMISTSGSAATRERGTPECALSCSPTYDLTGKVGGRCALCRDSPKPACSRATPPFLFLPGPLFLSGVGFCAPLCIQVFQAGRKSWGKPQVLHPGNDREGPKDQPRFLLPHASEMNAESQALGRGWV